MEQFAGTTRDITLKNYHTCICPVYILGTVLQGIISVLHKWELCSSAYIYLQHSLFHAGSATLVLDPENGHVSP